MEVSVSNFIKSASFLRREFEGRNQLNRLKFDRKFQFIYIFDTNVIVSKCAPWINGPRQPNGRPGYGEFFVSEHSSSEEVKALSEEENLRAEKTLAIVADHVISLTRSTENSIPIFQFPEHFHETYNVYRSVARKADRYGISLKKVEQRVNYELSRLAAVIKYRFDNNEDQNAVANNVRMVRDLLMGQKYSVANKVIREWDNYVKLAAEYGDVFSLESAEQFYVEDPDVTHSLEVLHEDKLSDHELSVYHSLVRYFTRSIRHLKGESIPTVNSDSLSLAQLHLLNYRLKKRNSNKRFVFITADEKLVKSTYGIRKKTSGSIACEAIGNFSEAYVRHIRAFSGDALFEFSEEENAKDIDLFDGLLANWSESTKINLSALEKIALRRSSLEDTGLDHKDIQEAQLEWEKLTDKAIKQYNLESYGDEEIIEKVIKDRIRKFSSSTTWSKVVLVLREDVSRVRDRTFLKLSDLGYETVIRAPIGRRNPPELVYDSLTNTNKIFSKLSSSSGYSGIEEFELDFQNIKDDCFDPGEQSNGDDRQLSHLKFLVLGAAFASADKWLVAFSHAKRAIEIIERSFKLPSDERNIRVKYNNLDEHEKTTFMSGREAYFLAAVCQRILAGSTEELDKARDYLDRAIRAYKKDKNNSTTRISIYRFLNEKLALSLSKYYLSRSNEPMEPKNNLAFEIYETAHALLTRLNRVSDTKYGSKNFKYPKSIDRITKVSIATNLIQVAVIEEYRVSQKIQSGNLSKIDKDALKLSLETIYMYTDYKDNDLTANKLATTNLVAMYALVGELLLNGKKSDSVNKINEIFSNIEMKAITKYDTWRFNRLQSFARSLVGEILEEDEMMHTPNY